VTEHAPRWIDLVGGANARDVGGLPTRDGRRTRSGRLIRSANLQYLTDADLALLVTELGVRRVVDLRTDVEVVSEGPGPMHDEPTVVIHHLSLFPDSEADSEAPEIIDEVDAVTEDPSGTGGRLLPWRERQPPPAHTGNKTADLYLTYLDLRPDSVVAALRAIAQPDGATLVHCAAGKDRTGVIIAIALSLVGVERASITADYAATEQQLSAVIRLLARTPTYEVEVSDPDSVPRPRADVMEATLDALEARAGGIAGWLGQHGWTDHDTEALRSSLLGAGVRSAE
jgi:protein tyrosine/serine phosphatase